MLTKDNLYNYWRYCLLIDSDLETTSRFVDVQEANYSAFSSEYSKIILLACSEIDVICRLLCQEIDPGFNERNSNFEVYTKIILTRFVKLVECKLEITYSNAIIKPFEGWSISPYTSPNWWRAYQGVKHSRHKNFHDANLLNAINSVAGLIILNLYLFRLVTNERYANPYPHPKVFDSSCFSPRMLLRANEELPGFIS